jgi:hypothetical protein
MPDTNAKVVRNTADKTCNYCGGIHDYITRMPTTGFKDCATPVAFSHDKALKMARLLGGGTDAVVDAPHDTFVIMDDSARKLPHGEPVMLAQLTELEILA